MLSATGAIAAFAILALAVNVIDTDAPPPDQAAGTLVVAADGSGDFATIQAAVDAAEPGDTISITPGEYVEAIVIDKDLTLAGDGPREEIVIGAPEDGPRQDIDFAWFPAARYAILVEAHNVALEGFTLRGVDSRLFVDWTQDGEEGARASLEGLLVDAVATKYDGTNDPNSTCAVVVNADTEAYVEDNLFRSGGSLCVFGVGSVFGNEFSEGATISGTFEGVSVVEGNHLHGPGYQGIVFLGDTGAAFWDNTIVDRERAFTPGDGIRLSSGFAPGIMSNDIDGADVGISISSGTDALVGQNAVAQSRVGIELGRTDAEVSLNDLSGNEVGILVTGGQPTLGGNTIQGNDIGVSLGTAAEPIFTNNLICDNETDVRVLGDVQPDLSGNQPCDTASS